MLRLNIALGLMLMVAACVRATDGNEEWAKRFIALDGRYIERSEKLDLDKQYILYRYAMHATHPPKMGLAQPIVGRGPEALSFLRDRLSSDVSDIEFRDIVLILYLMHGRDLFVASEHPELSRQVESRLSDVQSAALQDALKRQVREMGMVP